jgi:hypothetical protein
VSSSPPVPPTILKILNSKRMITQHWFPKDIAIKGSKVLKKVTLKTVAQRRNPELFM